MIIKKIVVTSHSNLKDLSVKNKNVFVILFPVFALLLYDRSA